MLFHDFVRVSLLLAIAIFSHSAFATSFASSKEFVHVPEVQWFPCFQEIGPFECANYTVPLDYSRTSKYFYVSGDQPGITLAVIRLPATDPENKIGSLFLNPGGPGGSGVNFALNAGQVLYTPEVRAKFDIVGFDPRGVARSTPLRCLTSFDLLDEFSALRAYPETLHEAFAQLDVERRFRKECDANAGPIIDNMTTADVARDMDILRLAVGDHQLTYAGFSYGSFLGVTYASLFPHNVRALIVDAVLDPIQWTTGKGKTRRLPFSTRLRSDAGAGATLEEFFRLCDLAGAPRCPLAGGAADRYFELLERLKDEPVVLVFQDGSELVIDNIFLTSVTLSVLYNPFDWFVFASDLAFIELLATSFAPAADFNFLGRTRDREENPDVMFQTLEAFPGVACSDSNNPRFGLAWIFASAISERNFGIFGPAWTWASSICARWPGSKSSRYKGPFTRNTANPVLVTSTEFDPATRFEGAVKVSELLPNSHLLTVEGWGHTTLFLSNCATQIASDYLVNQSLPGSASTCQVDEPPFFLSPAEVYPAAAGIATQRSVDPAAKGRVPDSSASFENSNEANRKDALRSIMGDRPTYQRR
ncbi:MAG: alpha/beta hydrolase [Woeseiaceae bacterium]